MLIMSNRLQLLYSDSGYRDPFYQKSFPYRPIKSSLIWGVFPRGQISATLKGSLTYFDGELNEGSESVDRVERHFASQIRGNELLPRLKI